MFKSVKHFHDAGVSRQLGLAGSVRWRRLSEARNNIGVQSGGARVLSCWLIFIASKKGTSVEVRDRRGEASSGMGISRRFHRGETATSAEWSDEIS
jgi:hypothetical protein